jgi:hypothetical protein
MPVAKTVQTDIYKEALQGVYIQRKLSIGSVDDPLEQEADTMADTIMRMPEQPFVQRKCAHCDEEEKVQRKPLAASITPFIQTKGADGGTASDTVTQQINTTSGSGGRMDGHTQSFMQSRFGTDFSNVKIHTSDYAVQMSRELNAQAFTVGSDIYFNSGKYNPSSDSGKHLLAHELTHTVQQGGADIKKSPLEHRDPIHSGLEDEFSRETGTPRDSVSHHSPAYEAWLNRNNDARQMVEAAIGYFNNAVSSYQAARIDQAALNQILPNIISIATTNINLIYTRLNNDPQLLATLKQAFKTALHTLFTRAATIIPNTSAIDLYLSNLYRLPVWAWPTVGTFTLTTDAQRRTFITDFTTALNRTDLLQGFTTLTTVQLENILRYFFRLVTDTQNMLAANLANDAALVAGLHGAYRTAVNNVLTKAVLSMPTETVLTLFMRYRYQNAGYIHEWADQDMAGATGAVPLGFTAAQLATGSVSFSYNGYNVIINPDGTQTGGGAATHGDFANSIPIHYNYNNANNRITSFTGPGAPILTIWTDYGPGNTPGMSSGYGRGTTADDTRLGNTGLGYHERSHSRDFLGFIANNPPVFTGRVGMTVTQFTAAVTAYNNALARMTRISELATDCVGSPNIVQHHTANGTATTVTC